MEVVILRRIAALILCLSLLVVPVRADTGTKYIALTFDDGPAGRFTRRLLEGLEARGVKATFFLCGYRVKDYPDVTRQIFEGGHEIGIHGYTHHPLCQMSAQEITREIRRTMELLPEGCHPLFLRPPGGNCSDAVVEAAKKDGLAILSWSVDPQDWAIHVSGPTVQAVTEKARDGDVILLHDMSDSSVEAAFQIIDILSRRGFQFVTATELARRKGAAPKPGAEYKCFP